MKKIKTRRILVVKHKNNFLHKKPFRIHYEKGRDLPVVPPYLNCIIYQNHFIIDYNGITGLFSVAQRSVSEGSTIRSLQPMASLSDIISPTYLSRQCFVYIFFTFYHILTKLSIDITDK